MPPLVLDLLKYLFLALIFLFLIRAVRVMYLDIAGPRARRVVPAASTQQAKSRAPERLVIQDPRGGKGKAHPIETELIIGRGDKCHIVLTDTYASQFHARVFLKDGEVYIEDMGSTNGTRLNGRRVTSAVPVQRGDRLRIGKTELVFRR